MAATTSDAPKPRRSLPRRIARGVGFAAGGVAGLVALTLGVVLVGANVDPGRHFIERQVASLTGNTVVVNGLSGRFPDALHIARIELRDTKGTWLTLENLTLDWSPLRMVGKTVRVDALNFDRLAIPRLPVSDSTKKTTSSGPTKTGLTIDLRHVNARRIDVGAPLAGLPAVFALEGHASVPELDALLNGLSFQKLPRADVLIDLKRLDATGALKVAATTDSRALALDLSVQDGVDGIVASLSQMPELAPVTLDLHLKGPTSAAALDLKVAAGAITSTINGKLDLLASTADVTAAVNAPAMTLSNSVSWASIALATHLTGAWTAPAGTGKLMVRQLVAGGAQIGTLDANFDGTDNGAPQDRLHLAAVADGVRIPGGSPTLLAAAPLKLDATYAPHAPTRPVVVNLSHPLVQLAANADTRPAVKGNAKLNLPDLAPLAAVGGQKLSGHADLVADFALPEAKGDTTTAALSGNIAVLGGLAQAVGLIGKDGKLAAHATLRKTGDAASGQAQDIRLDSFTLDGRTLHLVAGAHAVAKDGKTTLDDTKATLNLTDLAAALPSLRGTAALDLTASGPTDDLAAKAHLTSDFGTATMPKGPLTLDLDAQHVPSAPQAHLTASGKLDRAPLTLDVSAAQDKDGNRHVEIAKLDWNSAQGGGKLDLPAGRKIPLGNVDIRIKRLADLTNLIGQPISGALVAELGTTAANGAAPVKATINVSGDVAVSPYRVGALKLTGSVLDPEGSPSADLALTLDRVAAPSIAGNLRATVKGPQTALATQAQARFSELYGAPGMLDLAAVADIPGQKVRVTRLAATARGEDVRLQAPVTASWGKTMGVDHLRATVAPPGVPVASIDAAGTIKPTLALTVSLRNVTPALAKPFAPTLRAAGTVSGDAKLSGTLAAPKGHVQLTGRGLKMLTGDAAALPPAQIDATADLGGMSARIDARASAGSKATVQASGTVPTSSTGAIAMQTRGQVDLSLANGMLGASGRQALGQLAFDMNVRGTMARPTATGTVTLHKGDVQDFAQGFHLGNIESTVLAQGDSLTIQSFTAQAGKGTMELTGNVGLFRLGMPVDLHLVADKAQPVASDLLTAIMNADITVKGQADTRLNVAGGIDLPKVEVNIPNSMPSSVATLNVVRPGEKPPAPEAATSTRVIGLDLKVKSPGEFFVRGHGLDAEMAGLLHVGGTAATPSITGGFNMRRGMFSLGGITLNFTEGHVGFDGTGVSHKLDPTLDFTAERNANGQTAMLKVGGYASDPKITFASVPSLPQDEILAMLLFGTDVHSLSTTQKAELGAALATLAGGAGFDPLGTIRKTLGLDRLAVGGGSGVGNGGASIEAGKYVMKGVYVGAKQATSGSGTQAQVQVDLTKHLKLNTTVGTGGNVTGFTTPENDPGSSVGLIWQYSY
ncbi:translocation/assembly module TamB domain-containing protein [Acetobacter estunensis]|uniref:translocation/assembly module TamB domain-containing protein n=1 Tax=Acetobacter estunensis TaxID=104097 RepID=UPI001C2D3291|nr:translocation/assembly module TamB domain-containing protein [Acetobacter estunensis]MBV1837655.1 translocation/assembly module TamB domain-containing protein [Acetobacter estunensis]